MFGGTPSAPAPPAPPPPPPNPGTPATALTIQDARQRAAAGGGAGFDNTIANTGGAEGFQESTAGKKTLTGQ